VTLDHKKEVATFQDHVKHENSNKNHEIDDGEHYKVLTTFIMMVYVCRFNDAHRGSSIIAKC